MSLNGALQVGRTALVASQAGMQVAGNNMANAATEGFHRRSVHLTPARSEVIGRGHLVGQGVSIGAIRREIDTALQARYREAIGDEQAAASEHRFLAAIETFQNELSDHDLSTLVSTFFNSFSEAANNPADHAVRSVVIQHGTAVAGRIADMRRDYSNLLQDVDTRISTTVDVVNGLLGEIESISTEIVRTEAGVGEASALRDRRDQLIDELSKHLDVNVIEQGGNVDILVNSIPIFLAGSSRGVEMRQRNVNGNVEVSIRVAADGTQLDVKSGTIGGLLAQRGTNGSTPSIDALEQFTSELIHQVNRLHSQGQGQLGFTSITGTYGVDDTTANLNATAANLPFDVENGSFFINVTHLEQTGQRTAYRIDVDGDAMSMDDLVNEINVVGRRAERHRGARARAVTP